MKRYVYLLLVFAMAFSLVGAGLAQERGFQPTGDVSAESSFSLDAEKVSPQAKGVVDPREFRLISVIVTFKEGQEPANLESLTGGRTI